MRRLIAFALDALLTFAAAGVIIAVLSHASNREFFGPYPQLIVAALLFALAEYFYQGMTPGKFLMRIRVATGTGQPPTLFWLYVRSSVLFLLPGVISLLATVGLVLLFRVSLGHGVHEFLVAWILGAVSLVLLGLSRGSQALHDYLSRTAIVAASRAAPGKILSKREVSTVIVVAVWVLAISIVLWSETSPLKVPKQIGIDKQLHMLQAIALDTSELEEGIPEFFALYEDFHGATSPLPLGRLVDPDDLRKDPLLARLHPRTRVHTYEVHVTAKGLMNGRFQETVAKNVCRGIGKRTETRVCQVQFEYHGALLHVIYLSVYRRLLVLSINPDQSVAPILVTLTPPNGGEVHLATGMPQKLKMRREANRYKTIDPLN